MARVAVVIPVHNRAELLRAALDALAAQDYDDFEVIVVDDASSDRIGDVVHAAASAGLRARVLPNAGRGAVAARITGVAASSCEVLAFTDSDCEPEPGWLKAGLAAIDAGADLVNGRTVPARPMRPLERSVVSGEEGLYPTCNLFVRRAAYDRAGGFDADAGRRFGFRSSARSRGLGFGEDTVLAWTIIRQDGQATYAGDAVVRHAVLPGDPVDTLNRAWLGASFAMLLREIPELRGRLLTNRVFLGTRRVPLYAVLLATLARRRGLVALAAGWWLARLLRELSRLEGTTADRLRALPVEAAIDVVTGVALVAGSVRARSVVL